MDNWGQGTFTLFVSRLYRRAVRVSDDLRLPVELPAGLGRVSARPGWEVSADTRFESVQRDVRQQWRRDATLRCAGRRFGEHAIVEHPGLEPRFHEAVQGRECLHLAEEGLLVDAVVGREKPRLPLCFSPQVKPGVRISRTGLPRTPSQYGEVKIPDEAPSVGGVETMIDYVNSSKRQNAAGFAV